MTTAVLIALFVFVAIVITAAGRWRNRNERREATTHENELGHTAPRWAGVLNEKLNRLLAGQQRLHQHIGSEADADARRDLIIMATTQEKINELKAKIGPMSDAIAALTAAWDAYTAALEEAKDDPEELQAVIDAYEAQKAQILAMALKGTTPPPPPVE